MGKQIVKASLDLEIKGWEVRETSVAKKESDIKLSDGQGNHLVEGKYKLTDITVAEYVDPKDSTRTFKTLVGQANGQTIFISQFVKRGIDPSSGNLFTQSTGGWAEKLQAANNEGKAAKFVLEHPEFEIISSTRRDVKDPYTTEVKSKWCYVTK